MGLSPLDHQWGALPRQYAGLKLTCSALHSRGKQDLVLSQATFMVKPV
jgi:hypothetical protein